MFSIFTMILDLQDSSTEPIRSPRSTHWYSLRLPYIIVFHAHLFSFYFQYKTPQFVFLSLILSFVGQNKRTHHHHHRCHHHRFHHIIKIVVSFNCRDDILDIFLLWDCFATSFTSMIFILRSCLLHDIFLSLCHL